MGAGCLIEIVPPTYYRDHHEKDVFQHVNLKHMISFAMQVSYLYAKASFMFGLWRRHIRHDQTVRQAVEYCTRISVVWRDDRWNKEMHTDE